MILAWLKRRADARKHLILALLSERGEMFGLDLVEASNNKLHLGTVYVLLGKLEDAGMVYGSWVYKGTEKHRRIYGLTEQGRRATAEIGRTM